MGSLEHAVRGSPDLARRRPPVRCVGAVRSPAPSNGEEPRHRRGTLTITYLSKDEGYHSEPECSLGEESHVHSSVARDSSACDLRMTGPQNQCSTVLVSSLAVLLVLLLSATRLRAQQSDTELAKKLQNPIASLISVPIQNNWDFGIGSANALRYTTNIQPIIPFLLTNYWNLITRTIMPVIHAELQVKGGHDRSGLSDIVQSFFFSPTEPVGGWIMGGGPVFLYPSATDSALGSEKWGAGPTAVVLRQQSGWTYGMLANHLWSFAGTDRRQEVNATFLQPFLSYTTKTFTTFGVNTESTYDWENEQWTMPFNVYVAQLLKLGSQPMQFTLGGRAYADRSRGGPDWGLPFTVTALFPK